MTEGQQYPPGYKPLKQPKTAPVCRYCAECTPVWSGTGQWTCQESGQAWAAKYDDDKPAEEEAG